MAEAPGTIQPTTDEDVHGSSVTDVVSGQSAGGNLPSIKANAVASSNTIPRPMRRFSADCDGVVTQLASCDLV
tara:strand:+ start:187 stop:405 length:219 start_codon:yes stop_codon:yes gene_type:complete